MGRQKYSKRIFADGLLKIEIWWLKRQGYLQGGWRSGDINWPSKGINVKLLMDINQYSPRLWIAFGQHMATDQEIRLTYSDCNFGGRRLFFTCSSCYRRVTVLYQLNYLFSCRFCLDLRYKSRNLSRKLRIDPSFVALGNMIKIQKLQADLKRYTYAGFATKKFKRLARLYDQVPFLRPYMV